MKIQFFNGGLANQVFQYFFARGYELTNPGAIMYLDDSYFALHSVHNGYELTNVFGLHPHMVSSLFETDVWEYILNQKKEGLSLPQILSNNGSSIQMISETDNWQDFNPFDGIVMPIPANGYFPEIYGFPGDVYYHGYWINEKWWLQHKSVFLHELQFPELTDADNITYKDWILHSNSVAIHVRRGDYVTIGWALESAQYQRNIQAYITQYGFHHTAFVFSDDILWCKEHYAELGLSAFDDTIFVQGNEHGKNYIDLQLMSLCKGMILSNSAFCYLAALLNQNLVHLINPSKIRTITLSI